MSDDLGKFVIRSADQGINTGAHPANIPEDQIIDAKNMFVRGRGRIQQVRFPTPFSSQYPVLDQLPSPTHTIYTPVNPPGTPNLDDATFSGQYDETQIATIFKVKVQIVFAGAPDSIEWYYDTGGGYGAFQGSAPITGGAIAIGTTGLSVTFGATTGHTLNDYWEFYAVPMLVTNGSATVTSAISLTDTNYGMTYPLKADCGFYYKDGLGTGADYAWYRVVSVASDGLSFTLDRNFEYQTQGLTQRAALYQEHFMTFPVTAVINYKNTNDTETTCAVAGKYLRRWNGAGWDTEYTLNTWNERGMFLDYRGQAIFTNGSDEMLRSYTGDGDWDSLADPVIQKITVQHTESGYHNGTTVFTEVNGSSIDDAIFEGAYTGTPVSATVEEEVKIKVVIDGAATPDTFEWYIDTGSGYGAAQATGVPCATTATALAATGITVRFGATTGHQVGDTSEFYLVYDLTTYNVKVKDCLQTPTKALILTGTIEAFDIGNSVTQVAALVMRSLNKGRAWTVIEKHYRQRAVQNPGAYGTTTVGGLYLRKNGDIVTSIASVGDFSSTYTANGVPVIENFCYVLSSSEDGEAFAPILVIHGPLSTFQKSLTAADISNSAETLLSEWITTNAGKLVVKPFAGIGDAQVVKANNFGGNYNLKRPPHAFDQFAEATTSAAGTSLVCAGLYAESKGSNSYTDRACGLRIEYPPDPTGLRFGFRVDQGSGVIVPCVGRPLLLGPIGAYDPGLEYLDEGAYIYYVQGDPDATVTESYYNMRIYVARADGHLISNSESPPDRADFDYGNSGISPKGYPFFNVGATPSPGSRISRDIGAFGILGSWGEWHPINHYGKPVTPYVYWTNKSDNHYYLLSRKTVGANKRLVLSVSDDEGDTYHPVWQDNENNVATDYPRRVLHWSENEFIVIMEDSSSIYRCRYHVNAPKCKNVMAWRQRLLAYGEMRDLTSPRGATPDDISTDGKTLYYNGLDWEDDQLVGQRLYPDALGAGSATNDDVYYIVTSNDNNSVTVGTNMKSTITGIENLTYVFEIREYVPERVRISDVNRFDTWRPLNYFDEDDKVNSIRPYLQTEFETPQSGILVLLEEGHALYLGNDPDTWIRYSGKTQRGCIGNYAIAENMLLSHDALSVISNGTPQPLAGRLDTTLLQEASPSLFIETLSDAYKSESMGFLGKGLEFLCVPTEDSPWLDKAIMLDLLRGGFWTIDFPTYGGFSVFLAESNTAMSYPVPVCAFSDKSGYEIYAGCVSGIVWKLFDSKTAPGVGVETIIDITLPLNAGAPEEWFGIHKIAFMMNVATGGTLSYRFNPNMDGWTAFDTKTLSAGMNRVVITAPQPMEGNTIALNMKFSDSGHVEIDLPIEFSAQLKHSGIEEG